MNSKLDRAEKALANILLAHRCLVPKTQEQINEVVHKFGVPISQVNRETNHPAWFKLYYGETPKKALDHLAKLAKDFPAEAEVIRPFVTEMLEAKAAAEIERLAAKAALEARRAERATRQTKARDLGVDLKRIDERATEATYLKLRDTLDPIRVEVAARYLHQFRADNVKAKYPQADERLVKMAEDAARDNVWGFAAKLAGKIDREANGVALKSVAVRGSLWNWSTLTATLVDGTTTVWETKIILNTSCLGKLFNQWPTRLVK